MRPDHQAYLALRTIFTVAPILAGADKFLNALTTSVLRPARSRWPASHRPSTGSTRTSDERGVPNGRRRIQGQAVTGLGRSAGVALAATVLGANLLADGLYRAWDPRARQR